MEIPKKKIFIYILTFLTYAWSGYGADVISNLKDAVLAAEKVFGGVFENVIAIAKNFKNVKDVIDAAVEETCEFKCSSGVPGIPNKYHKPTSDGCGSYGVELAQFLKTADVTACCNNHDICYDTCNSGKEKCDFEMQRCLYKLCEGDLQMSDSAKTGCKATAKMLFAGTFSLGCKAYLDSQKKACFCKEPRRNRYKGGEL